jgi:hypothetical protein
MHGSIIDGIKTPRPLAIRGRHHAGKWRISDTHPETHKEAFGASLPPHWFRDAAATSIAIEDPRHVCDAHHVLGNTLAATEKYYNQARSLEASRRHQAMLAALRSSLNGRPQET